MYKKRLVNNYLAYDAYLDQDFSYDELNLRERDQNIKEKFLNLEKVMIRN